MVCEHLRALEDELIARGHKVDYRSPSSSGGTHERIYFDVVFDTEALQKRFAFASCVQVSSYLGKHDGAEHGFECVEHHDAILGRHPSMYEARPGSHESYIAYMKRLLEEKMYR